MFPDPVAFTGVGIGELAVAVVSQGEIAGAPLREPLDVGEVGAELVAVLDADQDDLLPGGGDATGVVRAPGQTDPVGGERGDQAVDGVELLERGRGGPRVGRGAEVLALADVDDQEGGVEPPILHGRDVDLGREPGGIASVGREVGRIDVDVGIEGENPLMDGAGARDQVGFLGVGVGPLERQQARACDEEPIGPDFQRHGGFVVRRVGRGERCGWGGWPGRARVSQRTRRRIRTAAATAESPRMAPRRPRWSSTPRNRWEPQ